MNSFESLYHKAVKAAVENNLDETFDRESIKNYDKRHLDCLLHPEDESAVIRINDCRCDEEQKQKCKDNCAYDAMTVSNEGNIQISKEDCTGCAVCVAKCSGQNLTDRKDLIPIFDMLHNSDTPMYAMIAPAFIGQFSHKVTPGMLRSAFKQLGFTGMIEVSLFADILTLKEALEFDKSILKDDDFLLTSCCCPLWIAMIRKIYHTYVPHVPPSVSPMVACGRSIKQLYPGAKTVYIGPCIAKKAEAKEKDIADAVDFVLTFQEISDIFKVAEIDPEAMHEDSRDHSSTGGRIYARTGGVSEAVKSTLQMIRPDKKIPLTAKQANGVPQCKELLNEIINGNITANFLEGMGCVGGCVGGPKILISKEEGTVNVNKYGQEATYKTPADNPFVMEMLHSLGFDTIDSLLAHDTIFTRDFTKPKS